MDNSSKLQEVILFHHEQTTALTVEVLNKTYPNVQFEAVEVGDGTYRVCVRSLYKESVEPHTLQSFMSDAVSIYQIVGIVVNKLKSEDLLKG